MEFLSPCGEEATVNLLMQNWFSKTLDETSGLNNEISQPTMPNGVISKAQHRGNRFLHGFH